MPTATRAGTTAGFESILDVCLSLGLPRKPAPLALPQPPRGADRLLQPHFYDGELVTFPSADRGRRCRAVTFDQVPDGRFKDGANPVEATKRRRAGAGALP